MAPRQPGIPTEGELEILGALWRLGPATVREVLHDLQRAREIGYTTVLKQMQIMFEKKLLERDESVRPQIYTTVRSEKQVQKKLVGDLLDRAFHGSPGNLILQALSTKRASQEERRRIRELLDRLEGESG